MPAKPTVRQLETLMSIAECGSFASAARLMNISQPAISKQIAALERNVGYEIFERAHGSRPTITPRGRALIARLPDLLQAVRSSGDQLIAAPQRVSEVRVACGDVIGDLLCMHLHRFYAEHPGIVIEVLHIDPSVASVVQLERDDIDLAYLTLSPTVSHRLGTPISTVYGGLYVSSAEPRLTRWTNDSDQQLPIIGPSRGSELDQELGSRLRALGVRNWQVVARMPLAAHRIQLALQGLGAILIMEHAVRPQVLTGRMQALGVSQNALKRYRFVNQQRSRNAAVRQVDAFVTDLLTAV